MPVAICLPALWEPSGEQGWGEKESPHYVHFHLILYLLCPTSLRACPSESCQTLCNPMDCCPSGSTVQGFSRQEHWSGLPSPSPGDLPDPGIKPMPLCLLHWETDSLSLVPPRKPSLFSTAKNLKAFARAEKTVTLSQRNSRCPQV